MPAISFKTGITYTSSSTSVSTNTTVQMGINASKSEEEDPLTLFSITRSYDGGAATQVYSENLSGTSGDSYSKDYSIVTRSTPGTEKK